MDVSVIIPTHNGAAQLPAALASVIAQTTSRRLELVVVDDGSTDTTPAVIEPYLKRYRNPTGKVYLHYLQQEHRGVAAARNAALAHANAPYVAFLDTDDYWDRFKLQRQFTAIREDPTIEMVHTAFRTIDQQGDFTDTEPQRLDNPCVGWCVEPMLRDHLVVLSSVLIRREVLDQVPTVEPNGNVFDPHRTHCSDYDFLLRLAKVCRFVYVPEPLTLVGVGTDDDVAVKLPGRLGALCQMQADFVARYGQALHLDAQRAHDDARQLLIRHAQALIDMGKHQTAAQVCDVAQQLDLYDQRFDELRHRATKGRWLRRPITFLRAIGGTLSRLLTKRRD